jgi:hypothetical protein
MLSITSEAYSDANGMLLEEDEAQDENIEAMRCVRLLILLVQTAGCTV